MIQILFDIDMPKSCEGCPFMVHCDSCESWENRCPILGKRIGYDYNKPYTPRDHRHENCPLKEVEERPHGEWVPIKLRPMTEEEVKEQEEKWGWTLYDKDKFMFDCPLPDEGQEILISARGGVSIDTCDYDPDYGYGLEENGDWDGITAWMPLPEPYKGGEAE